MNFFEQIAPIGGAIAGGMIGGPTGAMIGYGVGAGISANAGQREANQQTANLTREQMAFQERMASTAHQRQVADLKAAGLNPILSANSGAPSPSGASAEMRNANDGALNVMGQMLQIYQMKLQAAKQAEEINLMRSQKANVDMDTTVKAKGIPESEAKNKIWDAIKKMWRDSAETGARMKYDWEKSTLKKKVLP